MQSIFRPFFFFPLITKCGGIAPCACVDAAAAEAGLDLGVRRLGEVVELPPGAAPVEPAPPSIELFPG